MEGESKSGGAANMNAEGQKRGQQNPRALLLKRGLLERKLARKPHFVYLDYNATAPLLPIARQRILEVWRCGAGNASSTHRWGQQARWALEEARASLAEQLGCARQELCFTSGGSEADNAALRWVAQAPRPVHVIATPIEHPAVLRSCAWLEAQGVELSWLPVDGAGRVRAEAVEELLRPHTRLVSVMAVNNETGVIQPVAEVVQRVRAHPFGRETWLHSDSAQAFGRLARPWLRAEVDLMSVSAHKLGGPQGIGALVVRQGRSLPSFVLGGAQEGGRRAGTEAVALAAGFAGAAEWVCTRIDSTHKRLLRLRTQLEKRLLRLPQTRIHGQDAQRVSNTLSIAFAGVSAESLLVSLDLRGIGLSMGSACSSGALNPSPVLGAMGIPEEEAQSSLRISLGPRTTQAEMDYCAMVLREEVLRLRGKEIPQRPASLDAPRSISTWVARVPAQAADKTKFRSENLR